MADARRSYEPQRVCTYATRNTHTPTGVLSYTLVLDPGTSGPCMHTGTPALLRIKDGCESLQSGWEPWVYRRQQPYTYSPMTDSVPVERDGDLREGGGAGSSGCL